MLNTTLSNLELELHIAPSNTTKPTPAPWSFAEQQPTSPMAGKITEIILQDEDEYNFQLLMPLLAQLSQDNRWFAWIAPPKKMPKKWLMEAGIDINKIMVLQPSEDNSALDLAEKALATGTCHAVISWPGALGNDEFSQLQKAAKKGLSHAILVRPR